MERKPRAVIIDRAFRFPENDKTILTEVSKHRDLFTSLVLFVPNISASREIDLGDQYLISNKTNGNSLIEKFIVDNIASTQSKVYGPDPFYDSIVGHYGHSNFNSSSYTFAPYFRVKDKIVPHLALAGAQSVVFSEDGLKLDGKEVPLTLNGKTLINFRPTKVYKDHSFGMSRYSKSIGGKGFEGNINEGDIVILMFDFYTGSTVFFDGPFGPFPAGHLITTMADSITEGHWLSPSHFAWSFIVGAILLAVFLPSFVRPIYSLIVIVSVLLCYGATALTLFAYSSYVLPLLFPILLLPLIALFTSILRLVEEHTSKVRGEAKNQLLAEKIELVRLLSNNFLPKTQSFTVGDYSVAWCYTACEEVGGDWLHIWETKTEKAFIYGDVVGKSLGAGLTVSYIKGFLDAAMNEGKGIKAVFSELDKKLREGMPKVATTTATAFVFRDDFSCEVLNAAGMGFFYLNQNGATFHRGPSDFLGGSVDAEIATSSIVVEKGGQFLAFTDGYLEGSREMNNLKKKLSKLKQIDSIIAHDLLEELGSSTRKDDDKLLAVITRVAG
ncbi:MAG: hypothetical protein EOP04_13355 [Proteobacteria bacterium]|nr:MAG: hypothetical protein EOP04_13355 [Pseudomonadota bacterium]